MQRRFLYLDRPSSDITKRASTVAIGKIVLHLDKEESGHELKKIADKEEKKKLIANLLQGWTDRVSP